MAGYVLCRCKSCWTTSRLIDLGKLNNFTSAVRCKASLAGLAVCIAFATEASGWQTAEPPVDRAGNDSVQEIMQSFAPRGVQGDGSQPLSPRDALSAFSLRQGVSVDLVASEPEVSQPLFLSWDSKGRMWIVQYRQYQYPAGLKVIKFDNHLRAVFDKVPQAPPNHTPGRDVISVVEDTNGDGNYDSHREVISGLNIVSSVAIGNGGIWVLNPPYLLRYPDEDRDAIPDGDPVVHLQGFGLQDTHSVANSMLWGPDGWLYGANGSTTIGNVSSRVTPTTHFEGQCIWRYHPVTSEFEIYAEGGGNTFSLEIDSKGRVFAGTNGGNTRGWYFPQGSYSGKNWGKHGPLTNPYAFGFFGPMGFQGDGRRFPQAFAIYEGGLFDQSEFAGSIIAPNAMQNLIWHSERIPDGSTYRTEDKVNLAESSDRWFRPVYCGVGPDGAVYVADWYDTRLSHVSPTDDWHKNSGRVFRFFPTGEPPRYSQGDLHEKTDEQLIDLLDSPNKWVRRRSALELGWRPNLAESTLTGVIALAEQKQLLESVWILSLQDALSDSLVSRLLASPSEDIRRLTIRVLGDRRRSHPNLRELATKESSVQVRSQLAASARRLPPRDALPVIRELLTHADDVKDPHMPLMLWWAVQEHTDDWEEIRDFLSDESLLQLPLFRTAIATKIVQRYAASGMMEDLEHCSEIVNLARPSPLRNALIAGLYRAYQGRVMPPLPESLSQALREYRAEQGASELLFGLQQQSASAQQLALAKLKNSSTDIDTRIEIASAFGKHPSSDAMPVLLQLATRRSGEPALQRVAIQALAAYDDPRIPEQLCRSMGSSISADYGLRPTCCRTLASRLPWAIALLNEVDQWRLDPGQIPADVVQRLRTFTDPSIRQLTNKAFGKAGKIESQEQVEVIERLTEIIDQQPGDAKRGRPIFVRNCGNCHSLFGEGASSGPPLDNYDRRSLKFWLPAIAAPSIEIREGYQSYSALDSTGRVYTGMLVGQDLKLIKLRAADGTVHTLVKEELEEFRAIRTSLMPERILAPLSDSEIQDLFAYLRSNLPE